MTIPTLEALLERCVAGLLATLGSWIVLFYSVVVRAPQEDIGTIPDLPQRHITSHRLLCRETGAHGASCICQPLMRRSLAHHDSTSATAGGLGALRQQDKIDEVTELNHTEVNCFASAANWHRKQHKMAQADAKLKRCASLSKLNFFSLQSATALRTSA